MFKLANQILDAHDDISRTYLKKIALLNPKINLITPEERKSLQDDDFALTIITKKASKLNKFPVESADSTWLSNQYFNETHPRLPQEAAETAAYFIKKACDQFGIKTTPAVESLAKEANTNIYYEHDIISPVHRTVTVSLEKFAEVEKIGDNETYAQYVFATPAHVKLANKYFEEFSEKMPLEYRHKYACALQKRAGDFNVTLSGKITKYAANSYSAHVDAHLSSRKSLLEIADPKFTSALDKMASMKSGMPPMEFAKLLHAFDKRAGLAKYYGGYLINPYEATFATKVNPTAIYKSASHGTLTHDAIKNLATDKFAKIKEYLGSSVAEALQKEGSEIFESLPSDAKEIIAGIADGTL